MARPREECRTQVLAMMEFALWTVMEGTENAGNEYNGPRGDNRSLRHCQRELFLMKTSLSVKTHSACQSGMIRARGVDLFRPTSSLVRSHLTRYTARCARLGRRRWWWSNSNILDERLQSFAPHPVPTPVHRLASLLATLYFISPRFKNLVFRR